MRPVQRTRSSHNDLLEVGGVAGVKSRFHALVGIQIYPSIAVLQQAFRIGAGFVGIARLVAVRSMRGNGNLGIFRCGLET